MAAARVPAVPNQGPARQLGMMTAAATVDTELCLVRGGRDPRTDPEAGRPNHPHSGRSPEPQASRQYSPRYLALQKKPGPIVATPKLVSNRQAPWEIPILLRTAQVATARCRNLPTTLIRHATSAGFHEKAAPHRLMGEAFRKRVFREGPTRKPLTVGTEGDTGPPRVSPKQPAAGLRRDAVSKGTCSD